MFEISFPRDPTCTLFQASKRAYGIKISSSLRFCHFPFANRYRLYQKASIVPKPEIGSWLRVRPNIPINNMLQRSTFTLNLMSRGHRPAGIKTLYIVHGPAVTRWPGTPWRSNWLAPWSRVGRQTSRMTVKRAGPFQDIVEIYWK